MRVDGAAALSSRRQYYRYIFPRTHLLTACFSGRNIAMHKTSGETTMIKLGRVSKETRGAKVQGLVEDFDTCIEGENYSRPIRCPA